MVPEQPISKATLKPAALAARLLRWYGRARRDLPWRAPPGTLPDPYVVWLSEIMLQQTTVKVVEPYFRSFLDRWPGVRELAAASLDEVLAAWAGLGYYARARNLHRCAKLVVERHGGRFPEDEEALVALPGIGPYTAAAIAAIAYQRPATPVDGNAERVIARVFAIEEPLPGAKRTLRERTRPLTPARRAGDFAQALMDLGATLCTPRNPACGLCPWEGACAARRLGLAGELPRRAAKPARPTRHGVAFWIERADGAVLLRRRAEHGLLGGMMEVPSSDWRKPAWTASEARDVAPARLRWRALPGIVRHTFTHFHLELQVLAGHTEGGHRLDGTWCPRRELAAQALPSVMRKVAAHARAHLGG